MSALAVVVQNTLPAELVAIAPEILARALELSATASALIPTTAAELETANGIFREIDKLSKSIAAGRLELTRPIDALKAQVIAAERSATTPMDEAKAAVGKRMLHCQGELNRIAAEARRKAQEEAEAAAREARRIAEEERQSIIKKQQEEHAARVAEQQRADEAAKKRAELLGEDHEPETIIAPPPPPPPVVIVPEVLAPVVPDAPKLAVRATKRQVLEIVNAEELIAEACKNNGKIHGRLVVLVDEKAVEAMLKAGVPMPGARLVEKDGIAGNGSRRNAF
jgi:cell division septum initiation protein DivIVA